MQKAFSEALADGGAVARMGKTCRFTCPPMSGKSRAWGTL